MANLPNTSIGVPPVNIPSSGAHGHTSRFRQVYTGGGNFAAAASGQENEQTGLIVNTTGNHGHTIPAHNTNVLGSSIPLNSNPLNRSAFMWYRTA